MRKQKPSPEARDDDAGDGRADEAGAVDHGGVEGDGVAEIVCGRPTIWMRKDWRAGMSKALMRPWTAARAMISWMVMRWRG